MILVHLRSLVGHGLETFGAVEMHAACEHWLIWRHLASMAMASVFQLSPFITFFQRTMKMVSNSLNSRGRYWPYRKNLRNLKTSSGSSLLSLLSSGLTSFAGSSSFAWIIIRNAFAISLQRLFFAETSPFVADHSSSISSTLRTLIRSVGSQTWRGSHPG